jgi:hypothetical protein
MESIMWTLLSLIYRYYCRSQLMEIRKVRFTSLA